MAQGSGGLPFTAAKVYQLNALAVTVTSSTTHSFGIVTSQAPVQPQGTLYERGTSGHFFRSHKNDANSMYSRTACGHSHTNTVQPATESSKLTDRDHSP